MRIVGLLLGTSLLSACGGAGPQSAGSAPSPTSAPGTGTTSPHTFAAPTEVKTYRANGSSHSYVYEVDQNTPISQAGVVGQQSTSSQSSQLYQGNATTIRDSNLSITYSPRDAIFDITLSDSKAGITQTSRFQDPLHRTDFGGDRAPQSGTPQLTAPGVQYLQRGTAENVTTTSADIGIELDVGKTSGSYDVSTFFYQRPGTSTKYVTFAGFLRNNLSISQTRINPVPARPAAPGQAATDAVDGSIVINRKYDLSRGLYTFGENSSNSAVPTSGTGSFTGTMVASLVFNDRLDIDGTTPTFFQWLQGTANTKFDFGRNTFSLDLSGTTFAPQLDGVSNPVFSIRGGAQFNAVGGGQIDLVRAGGFLGQFSSAWFINPDQSRINVVIGGSSINGGFYGPKAEEVGGNFRIVGGTPDERVDILGVFVGK